MKTSLRQLQTSTNAQLAQHQERQDLTPSAEVTRQQIAYSRRRVAALLEQQEHLQALASVEPQQHDYGNDTGEAWQQDFVLLRDVQPIDGLKHRGQQLRNYIWSQIPNSRFKRFQELFSAPEQFCVPHFTTSAEGDIHFGTVNFNTMSLRGCVADVDHMPDDLLEELQLCTFDATDSTLEYLQKKTNTIPALKKLWESLLPMQRGHHRLLLVEEPSERVAGQYSEVPNPDVDVLGKIIYVRENTNGEPIKRSRTQPPAPRKLTASVFDSVYHAHRKTTHEETWYSQETSTLATIARRIADIRDRLQTDWRDTELRSLLQAEAQDVLTDCAERLEHCIEGNKRKVHELIGNCVEIRDSLGRSNPVASMSKLSAALRALGTRNHQKTSKGGFNQQDRITLERWIQTGEGALADFGGQVVAAGTRVQPNIVLFDRIDLTDAQTTSNATGLLNRVALRPEQLHPLRAQPFRTYRDAHLAAYGEFSQQCHEANCTGAQTQLVRMHVNGKFAELRRRFEQIKAWTNDAENIHISRIRTFVAELQQIFGARTLYPDIVIESMESNFVELAEALEVIEARLAFYETDDSDVTARSEMYGRLKTYLDTFDIEAMVR